MRVSVLRGALVSVTASFVFEEADDLQLSRLRVGSVHFNGHFDPHRFCLENNPS